MHNLQVSFVKCYPLYMCTCIYIYIDRRYIYLVSAFRRLTARLVFSLFSVHLNAFVFMTYKNQILPFRQVYLLFAGEQKKQMWTQPRPATCRMGIGRHPGTRCCRLTLVLCYLAARLAAPAKGYCKDTKRLARELEEGDLAGVVNCF